MCLITAQAGAIKGSKTQDLVGLRNLRLKHQTTTNDAESGSSLDAEALDYFPLLLGEYKIRMSKVFQDMKEYYMQRQSDGLAIQDMYCLLQDPWNFNPNTTNQKIQYKSEISHHLVTSSVSVKPPEKIANNREEC